MKICFGMSIKNLNFWWYKHHDTKVRKKDSSSLSKAWITFNISICFTVIIVGALNILSFGVHWKLWTNLSLKQGLKSAKNETEVKRAAIHHIITCTMLIKPHKTQYLTIA